LRENRMMKGSDLNDAFAGQPAQPSDRA